MRGFWTARPIGIQSDRGNSIQFGATMSGVHVTHAPRHARAFFERGDLPRKPVTLMLT